MKTLIAGENLPLPAAHVLLTFYHTLRQGELDLSAYLLLESTGKVRGDQDMIFYGQKSDLNYAIALEIGTNKNIFRLDTSKIAPEINKIKICGTLDGAENFTVLQKLTFQLESGGQVIADAQEIFTHRRESAMILAEIYRYKESWKCRWVMQGFNTFQLKELAEYFGIEVADNSAPPAAQNLQEVPPKSHVISENLSPPPSEISFNPPVEMISKPSTGTSP